MLPDKMMQSDILDILFENRNKKYGAYALRKEYHQRLYASILITSGIAILFVLVAQLNHPAKSLSSGFIIPDPNDWISITLEPDKPEVPITTSTPVQKPPATMDYSNILIVPDITPVKPIPAMQDLLNKQIGNVSIDGDPVNGNPALQSGAFGNSKGIEPASVPPVIIETPPIILEHAEIMPEFPGGINAFQKFMHRYLPQPEDIQPGEKVTVLVKFVIDQNGNISAAEITNSGRIDLDKEVLKAINKMPKWIPGMQNGHPVSVYFKLPVTFIGQD